MTNDERVRAELARAKDDVLHPWHADEPLPWDSHPEETTMDDYWHEETYGRSEDEVADARRQEIEDRVGQFCDDERDEDEG